LYSADGKTLLYCPATKAGVFTVPSGTQAIAPGAFVGCQELTEVVLPNTMTLIGEAAFAGLKSELVKVTLAGNAFNDLIIDPYAFLGCKALEEFVQEEGSRLTVIGERAFYDCTVLTSFEIPATLAEIGTEAFRGCTKLATVTFAPTSKPLVFGENVFYGCTGLKTISLPANVSKIPGIFYGCKNLKEVLVDPNSAYFTSIDGVLFNKDETELLFFPIGKTGDYTIPATVKKIADSAFAYTTGIKTLTIYNTIEVIGANAFREATISGGIVFVDHETLQSADSLMIGDYAFFKTKNGKSSSYMDLILPNHTTVIGEYAFSRTYHNKFNWGSAPIVEIGAHAFESNSYLDKNTEPLVIPATVKVLNDYVFKSSDIKYITLSEGIEYIGEYAFNACSYLTEIVIPASVKEIGAHAFHSAQKLKSVTFAPNSQLTTIQGYAFYKCGSNSSNALTTISIPASVTHIGAYAFADCVYLATVIFEESADEATAPDLILGGDYVYADVDDGVNVIVTERGNVFNGCDRLKSVTLPGRMTEIAEYTFYDVGNKLENVTVTVTFAENGRMHVIGQHAFDSAKLGEIVLPNSLQNLAPVVNGNEAYDRLAIGAYAFNDSAVTKITFAPGGTGNVTIGEGAFYKCVTLTEIVLPATLADYTSHTGDVITALQGGAGVFVGAEVKVAYVPTALLTISVEEKAGALYRSVDGVLYKTNGTDVVELIACPYARTAAVVVPATVTKIGDLAFFGCSGLTAITLTEGTADMTIGEKAFGYCEALETLMLPANVVSIGTSAFYYCENLTDLTLSAKLEHFEGAMVEGCDSLANVNVGADNIGVNYASMGGVLFSADMKTVVFYPAARLGEDFTIPGTVTVIAPNTFAGNSGLKEVIIGEGVIEIGANAFQGSSITKITIPSTVTLIDEGAFWACASLTEVIFTEGGTDPLIIGNQAFRFDRALTSISFPARLLSIGDEAFVQATYGGLASMTFAENCQLMFIGDKAFSKTNLVNVVLPAGVESMGDMVFYDCMALTSVTIGEGMTAIGSQVFAICINLVEVHFPSTLRTMGTNTFFDGTTAKIICAKLTTVTFGENSQLQAIPAGTFAYCTALAEIVIPASVKGITYYDHEENSAYKKFVGAFDHCSALTSVIFEEGTQCAVIGAYAFSQSGLKEIVLPSSVSTLGKRAFYATKITTLVIPETCTNFGVGAFYECEKLETVVLNTKATALAEDMFSGCSALTEIVIPETVSDLSASYIFHECSSLRKVTILGTVKVLGKSIFEDCSSLAEINLPEGLEVISSGAFGYCDALTTITLPASLHTIGDGSLSASGAFEGAGLVEYRVAEGNQTFASVEGILFSADRTKMMAYPPNRTATTLTIPKEMTELGDSAFANIKVLQYVFFEEGSILNLTIGDKAFYGCTSLRAVILPERVTSIGKSAFEGCSSLTSVHLPSTLREIGDRAFYSDEKLVQVGNYSDDIVLDLAEVYDTTEVFYGKLADSALYYYTKNKGYRYMGEDDQGNAIVTEIETGNRLTTDDKGFMILDFGTDKYLVGYMGTDTEVVIPDGITDIYTYAFHENVGNNAVITSVTIADSVVKLHQYAFYYCKSLSEIHFGTGLKEIDSYTFENCKAMAGKPLGLPAGIETMGVIIFNNGCPKFYVRETENQPGWSYHATTMGKRWNYQADVVYGWTGEDVTYTFVVDPANESLNQTVTALYRFSIEDVPVQEKYVINGENYYFGGWFEDAACTTAATGEYYNANGLTFYAKLYTEQEWNQMLYGGTSFDWAWDLELKQESVTVSTNSSNDKKTYDYYAATTVVIDVKGEMIYYKFTATENGTVTFQGNCYDTSGKLKLCNSQGFVYSAPESTALLKTDTSSLGKNQFQITFEVEAGETYYLAVKHDRATSTGDLPVILLFEPAEAETETTPEG
ncbi:MAG: leucine-rich repeat protein, partial [Clostridia bacterium]|nr:leucine-rich repeat protein [Clostridia bacterium]